MSNRGQPIQCALIVGAGWVGRQVAARFAQAGLYVVLADKSPDVCRDAMDWLRELGTTPATHGTLHSTLATANVASVVQSDTVSGDTVSCDSVSSKNSPSENFLGQDALGQDAPPWLAQVRMVAAAADCLGDGGPPPQLVLECVPELISLKKRTLRSLSREFAPPTILASNSSYFVPSVLSQFVDAPQRFAHLHFHVPVLRDSVADIVGCELTSAATIEALNQLVHRIGIEPLVLRNEHPGYIFNWLLQSVLKSALQLAASDVADPEMIDKSWKSVTGMPLGPFGMMDQIGLDVIEQVLSNSRWAPPPEVDTEQLLAIIKAKTQAGQLGTKTQQGFYDYRPPAD